MHRAVSAKARSLKPLRAGRSFLLMQESFDVTIHPLTPAEALTHRIC